MSFLLVLSVAPHCSADTLSAVRGRLARTALHRSNGNQDATRADDPVPLFRNSLVSYLVRTVQEKLQFNLLHAEQVETHGNTRRSPSLPTVAMEMLLLC